MTRRHLIPLLTGALLVACGETDTRYRTDSVAMRQAEPSEKKSFSMPGYTEIAVADGGTISGRVTLDGPAPALPSFEISAHPDVCGTATKNNRLEVGPGKGIRWAVVWLEDVRQGKPFSSKETEGLLMDQVGCQYTPHIVAAPVGASVAVLNSDDAPHNVRIEDASNDYVLVNRAQPSKGMRDTFRVIEAGPFPVGCDYHPWMNAYIFGVSNPYYAVTGADGSFTIDGVPPGTYRVRMWLNGVETRPLKDTRGVMVGYRFGAPLLDSAQVTVSPKGEAKVEFAVDVRRLASGGSAKKKEG